MCENQDHSTDATDDDYTSDEQESPKPEMRVYARTETEEAVAKRMLSLLRAGADFRAQKVRKLRAAVRVKAYENQLKLSIAVDRMHRQLEEEAAENAA
jgi:hypothetical protein